ncbi:MAG: dethiobiotin synthase [Verrucomicrobiota bacterium]
MKQRGEARTLFITGTDTGVGKTVLSGLLLHHLRQAGCQALAMKPFCCGGAGDVKLLGALQDGELSAGEINPFYFAEAVAPVVAARKHGRCVRLCEVLRKVRELAERCDWLLIEGAGGLLAPLGEDFTALDVCRRLGCEVIVVARNQLGVLNHTLLTVGALRAAGVEDARVVLMERRRPDCSAASNARLLAEWLAPTPLFGVPYLGPRCGAAEPVKRNARRIKRTLARILRTQPGGRACAAIGCKES